jgi:RecB family endonuclease NucS
MSTNAPSRRHLNPKPGDDDRFFKLDAQHFRRYDRQTDPAPFHDGAAHSRENDVFAEPVDDQDGVESGGTEFAYESDLRDYLARNLSLIEAGLRLYQEEGVSGVEFPVGGRFIDILAIDSGGGLVVIEMKVSRGYDRVVGQLLRYMGWVRANLTDENQGVRGVIVAREITEDLQLASAEAGGIALLEYSLSVTLRRVS